MVIHPVNSLFLNTVGSVAGAGVLTAGDVNIAAASVGTGTGASSVIVTNGANPMTLTLTTGTGDAYITKTGAGALTLLASSGNLLDLDASASAVATGGNLTYASDINITTNSMTNAFAIQSTGGDININSVVGSGLTFDWWSWPGRRNL